MKALAFLALFVLLIGGVYAREAAVTATAAVTTAQPNLIPAAPERQKIAEDFIKSSITYKAKGKDLAFVKEKDGAYTFTFTAKDAGYGKLVSRTGLAKNTVVKSKEVTRTIAVVVKDGKVASAVIDNAWDEIAQKYVTSAAYKKSQPMKLTPTSVNLRDYERAKIIAENWIRTAPTYLTDGFGLAFVDWKTDIANADKYLLTFSFKTRHSGYGSESTNANAQVTAHRIVVGVLDGKAVSAIIDEKWDEMTQKESTDNKRIGLVMMSYQPTLCQKTPWQEWYEKEKARFDKKPTEESLIISYYTTVFNYQVTNVAKSIKAGTCDKCGCATPYAFTTQIKARDEARLKNQGWTRA